MRDAFLGTWVAASLLLGQLPKHGIIADYAQPVKEMSAKTMGNSHRTLVLGSTSRYRRGLLERLRLPFVVASPDIDEDAQPGEAPAATALRLSEAKARAVAARFDDALVIGSDQVADCDGRPISKPGDRSRAIAQLRELSGRTIVFYTGVALVDTRSGRCGSDLVAVTSKFRTLTDREIVTYVDREEPYDCAGAVRSEALGIALFERITSDDPTALIGLPLIALTRLLRAEGVDVLDSAGFH
jgi:septum formation protein